MARVTAKKGTTVVRRVADHVRTRIAREQLKRGAPLPSYRELTDELGVAYLTVKRGMDELVTEGVICQEHGRGTFVAKELSLAPSELGHVGMIFPGSRELLFRYQYLGEIMQGITRGSPPQTDMHIFSLREDGMVRAAQLGEWAVNGVILLGVENDDYLRAFAQWGTPGVVVDYCSTAAPLDYVACDNRVAARQVVAHLAALGHRRVAYAAMHSQRQVHLRDNPQDLLLRDSSDARERLDGTVCALRERDMLADVWSLSGPHNDDWAAVTAEELRRRAGVADCPTALVTDSNHSAVLLLKALACHGLRAPEDISVCAVASDSAVMPDGRRLTTCRFDFIGMGRKAIDLLSARCRKPGLDKPHIHRIGFKFVEGQTTGRINPS
jgi:GntR family transcriptional regulator